MASIEALDDEQEELARAIAMSLQVTDVPTECQPPSGSDQNKPDTQERDSSQSESNQASTLQPKDSLPGPLSFPNLECMQILLSMGLSENASKRGLYHTGNCSADLAAGWVFEHLEDPDLHTPFNPPTAVISDTHFKSITSKVDSFKMVFVVNCSLQMGVGKVCAQVGHATLALYKTLLLTPSQVGDVEKWEESGAKKIVVKCSNADELERLQALAKSKSLVGIVIRDAGKTQIPSGSVTVLAVFGSEERVDEITGNLSLL